MNLSHIVAMSENRVIGRNNTIPWHIPEDLKHFKQLTQNHTIIMGRKTFQSIGKPLPKRRNIIISRDKTLKIDGVDTYSSVEDALKTCDPSQEIFIIGGGEIYQQTLPLVTTIHLTIVHQVINGDILYPEIPSNFDLLQKEDLDLKIPISFLTYRRK